MSVAVFSSGWPRSRECMKCGWAGLRGIHGKASGIGGERGRTGAGLLSIRETISAGREARPRAECSGDEARQPSGVRRFPLGAATPPSSVPGLHFLDAHMTDTACELVTVDGVAVAEEISRSVLTASSRATRRSGQRWCHKYRLICGGHSGLRAP